MTKNEFVLELATRMFTLQFKPDDYFNYRTIKQGYNQAVLDALEISNQLKWRDE